MKTKQPIWAYIMGAASSGEAWLVRQITSGAYVIKPLGVISHWGCTKVYMAKYEIMISCCINMSGVIEAIVIYDVSYL